MERLLSPGSRNPTQATLNRPDMLRSGVEFPIYADWAPVFGLRHDDVSVGIPVPPGGERTDRRDAREGRSVALPRRHTDQTGHDRRPHQPRYTAGVAHRDNSSGKHPVRSGRSMHTACYLTCGSDDCRIGRSPFANPPLAEVARRKLRLAASPDEVRPESHAREPE